MPCETYDLQALYGMNLYIISQISVTRTNDMAPNLLQGTQGATEYYACTKTLSPNENVNCLFFNNIPHSLQLKMTKRRSPSIIIMIAIIP